ncbi:hypothetical protein ACERK3_07450 [Phycisphaerales bacterium AB-hyl4]|uniref:Response regulator receiver domain-containing protein n=1 Tax=Natronomicrosphaera hydrolytica TaxID=3242702 RepID=A0ABV4U489_9BACT
MNRLQILVISPTPFVAAFLTEHLATDRFAVQSVRPGTEANAMGRAASLHVAVVDRIEQRPEAAQKEIALLKEAHPQVRIIAISWNSSARDAGIVEQGLFYYWTGKPRPELIELVEAAAAELQREGGTLMR